MSGIREEVERWENTTVKKAIDKFGYKITPLKEGLEETISWYRDYIDEGKNDKNL